MPIRLANYQDAPAIKSLMETLGYSARVSILIDQLETEFGNKDHEVIVFVLKTEVVGFASLHYLPQLAFDGSLMIISYFSIDPALDKTGIAAEFERSITEKARQRKCERIQVHCQEARTAAHQFYLQQGYQEYPRYFTKRLVYAE